MTRDMTSGKPLKHIMIFFLPILMGNLFQQFYNMADTIIVGRFVGVGALAAVGASGALCFLIIGFVMGMCSGFGIPVSRYFGAKDDKNLRICIVNQFYLCIALTVILTTISMLSLDWLLTIMNTPEDIYQDTYNYLIIIFAGIGVTFFYNMLATISRALGDSRTPLYFLMLASLLNIALDLLFIIVFDMGTAGVGYATVIAQAVSGILCLFFMRRKFPELRFKKEDMRVDRHAMSYLLHMGFPMALQFSITAIGSIILQSAINPLGSGIVAAVTAAQKVQMVLTQPLEAMGATMATYCSQNLGAGKISRISEGVRKALYVVVGVGILVGVIALLFGVSISKLFITGAGEEIFENIRQYFFWNSFFFAPLGILLLLRNSIQGMGFAMPAMLAGVFELAARSLVGILMVAPLGYVAICIANPAAWVFADFLLIPVYLYAIRILRQRFPEAEEQSELRISQEGNTRDRITELSDSLFVEEPADATYAPDIEPEAVAPENCPNESEGVATS